METLSLSTALENKTSKKAAYEQAGVEEYWIVSPQGTIEIYYLENGKYILEQSYMLQDDKGDEHYNAETIINLKAFPHIQIKLGEIIGRSDAAAGNQAFPASFSASFLYSGKATPYCPPSRTTSQIRPSNSDGRPF